MMLDLNNGRSCGTIMYSTNLEIHGFNRFLADGCDKTSAYLSHNLRCMVTCTHLMITSVSGCRSSMMVCMGWLHSQA
jgi:hypothetical protein